MKSVLFVCSANICRSPMAVGLLQAKVSDVDWRIESAGVWAQPGYKAARNTLKVLKQRGIDLSVHRSQPITKELVQEFDLILTMESGHKEALRAAFPQDASRIYMLSEMAGSRLDIIDPIGRTMADFEDTALEIDAFLDQGFAKIQSLTGIRGT